ncbi:MAG: hypothetical protein LBC14_08250 [Desulfovibrio sp.]|nr:hypothetical protein [Desulfovibrio sp.]
MPPYRLDDNAFPDLCRSRQLSTWAEHLLRRKIEEVRRLEKPRSLGGAFYGKWGYPAGKFHIICRIDDAARVVIIKTLARLG